MKRTKENKGITLVALVITIVVLLIIASITIYSGTINVDGIKSKNKVAELEMVKHAVLEQYSKYDLTKNEVYLIGTVVPQTEMNTIASSMGIRLVTIPSTYDGKDYYRLSPSDLQKIGVTNTKDTYIVNYVSGEVINDTVRVTKNGDQLYTYARNNFS